MDRQLTGSELLIAFIMLIIIASITSYYAEKKGRNSTVWFILTILFGPIVPLILFFLSTLNADGSTETVEQKKKKEEETLALLNTPTTPLQAVGSEAAANIDKNEQMAYLQEDKLWYYLDQDHRQYGPISLIGLRELWNNGKVDLNSYAWSEGMASWEKIENLPDLHKALANMKDML